MGRRGSQAWGPLGSLPVRQLQDRQGRITRLPRSGVPVRSRGVAACPIPPASWAQTRQVSKGALLVPSTSTAPPSRDSAGPIICGLLSSPDVLLCHVRDWRDPSEAQADATCPGVTYDQDSRQGTLRLGGQEFKSKSRPSSSVCCFTVIVHTSKACCSAVRPPRSLGFRLPLGWAE